jgi:hypothetical protein
MNEVLDVRLAGGVADHGRAGRARGREQRVLRRHDRRLVHEHIARAQPPGRAQLDVASVLEGRAERGEGVQVRVQAPATDDVAAGRRHPHAAEAREQRAGEQERRPDALGQLAIDDGLLGRQVGRAEGDLMVREPRDPHAERLEDREHGAHVLDLRDVADHDLVLGQDRGGKDGEGTVLVTGGHDRAGQRDASVDDELLHERAPSSDASRAGGLG